MHIRRYAAKLAQRTAIAGAGALLIASAIDGADLMGQARADNPQCAATSTDPCPPVPDRSITVRDAGPQPADRPHGHLICQPAGKSGAFCYRR
ncbi:hypothetical protein AWC26_10770 [Mycobacterium shimoidei]|uniref:Uncharacterized protein n=1 Tax=Mycobacterium shimoidei TaxID=29313 RepID=A0A1E3TJX9_MYCSH|nr:hypothetical protein BHQ16_05095 [Mycobacterium shimoidei]ORW80378.1 hypothetical protein AWC26_10770 [Mycobacterium shimoidei]SRX95931.1 hypothetical protein MSP7336_04204 [Mycobacterium shimoidei]